MSTGMMNRTASGILSVLICVPAASAQWEIFEDENIESVCGIVNAATLEFVVRSCDGALVLVTGEDAGFGNTFVTLVDSEVRIDGQFAGIVSYELDADGFFTLWWLSEEGFVIDFDDVNYEPFETDFLPGEFENVPCAAAEFWDGDADCGAEFGDMTMLPVDFVADTAGGFPMIACGSISFSLLLFTLAGLSLIQCHASGAGLRDDK